MADVRAKDIMIPLNDYPHIPHFFTLKQAVVLMENSTIKVGDRVSLPRSILVFDEKYQLVGLVRRRDLLRGLEPDFLRRMPLQNRRELFDVSVDSNLAEVTAGRIASEVIHQGERQVSELVHPLDARVKQTDSLARIVHEMVSHHQNLVPVTDENRIVGVVRSVDVFHEVAKLVI